MNGRRTVSGQLILGLSEHVTYWNRLGWTDPFSSEDFTSRQRAYAERFTLDSVLTPQMVINGREQIVGGDGAALKSAVEEQHASPYVPLEILSLQKTDPMLDLRYRVGSVPVRQRLDLMAVVVDDADR